MTSSKDMLNTKVHHIKKLKKHPGHILAIGLDGDLYIINVYIMSLIK
jgi:hypothetical protein